MFNLVVIVDLHPGLPPGSSRGLAGSISDASSHFELEEQNLTLNSAQSLGVERQTLSTLSW
jgi:hypothetical protein